MKKSLLLLLVLSLVYQLNAQPWVDSINQPYPNFHASRSAFNAFWNGRPVEKGMGYKTFKRWEWFWQSRLQPDGTLPQRAIAWNEWAKYQETHDQSATRQMGAANWSFKGPSNTASGYYGVGRLNTIAFHPTNPNIFYVGAPGGGLWKTTTGGTTWEALTDNLPVVGVTDIAIDPTNGNTIYIVTGDGDGADTYSIGVLKSTDGGLTWNTTGMSWNVTQYKLLRRIQINPANPQMLWVAASDGIWRTLNGGTTWTLVQSGYFVDLELKPNDPNTLYAANYTSSSSIYRSSNAGASFSLVTTIPGGRRMNIAVTPAKSSLVQVLVCNSSGGLHSLWRSQDGGDNFNQYYVGNSSNNMLSSSATGAASGGQGTYDLAFAVSPVDSNNVWIGGVNDWSSADGGATWSLRTAWTGGLVGASGVPVVHADKHFFAFHPLNPTVMYECNDGGLYRTSDGGSSWADLSAGLGISQIYCIGVSQSTANHVLAGLQDNSTKEFAGNSWYERKATGDGFESIIDPTNAATMYVSSYYGAISRSLNGGINWTTIAGSGGTGVNSQGPWLTPYVMHPTNTQTLLVGKKEVYRTLDAGASWSEISSFGGSSNITALAYAPSNPDVIYVAISSGLYKTIDGGANWSLIYGAPTTISYIAVHPSNPMKLWITQSNYLSYSKVRMSTDGGSTFTAINGTLPNLPVNCIVYENGSNDGLYIGTDVGVFYRDNTMVDWIPFQTGLPNVTVNELEISYNNNKIWAATYGRGLWNANLYSASPCVAPAVPVSGGDKVICQNAAMGILTATPPSGGQVDWYANATGGTALLVGANSFGSSTPGTFYAETRDPISGCVSATRTAIVLSVTPAPSTPTISSDGITSFCDNGSLLLTSSHAGTNQWYLSGIPVTGATGQTHAATQGGSYTVKAVVNSCSSANSPSVFLTANSAPPQPTISGTAGNMISSSPNGNQWYLNGTLIPGATGQMYMASTSGNYTVRVTSNGCQSLPSAAYNYVITAINSPVLDRQLRIAPNPVRKQLTITFSGTGAHFHMELLDITGQKIMASGQFTTSYRLDMERYPAGAYIVRVTNRRSGEKVQRMIVKE